MNKGILSLFVSSVIISGYAFAEETVTITLDLPKTTYGYGVLDMERQKYDTCAIYADGQIKDNNKTAASFKLPAGSHSFKAVCFSPVDGDGNRQTYFGSEVKTQTILNGQENNVFLPLMVVNPKKVTTKITSPYVSPGTWILKFLNGDSKTVILDDNNKFTSYFHDENPPIEIYSSKSIKVGDLVYPKYTYNLMPTIDIGVAESSAPTNISVVLDDGGYIYTVGLIINDRLSDESVVNFTVPNVPQGNYEVRITNEKGEIVFPYGEIVDSTNFKYIYSSVNNVLTLNGTTNFTYSFAGMDLTQKYRIVLLLRNDDI